MAIGHNHFVVHVGMACTKYEEIDNRKKPECVGAAPEMYSACREMRSAPRC
jgi:hypothetical protein